MQIKPHLSLLFIIPHEYSWRQRDRWRHIPRGMWRHAAMYDMKWHQNIAHSDEISRTGSESEESERESRGKDSDGSDE